MAVDFRVGIGFDSHLLETGRRLILGGVHIPHDRGLAGHSDGDVLSHAILDALLGAANLGDKGQRFPSSFAWCRTFRKLRQVSWSTSDRGRPTAVMDSRSPSAVYGPAPHALPV